MKKILLFLMAALLMGATNCSRQVADPSDYQAPTTTTPNRPDAVRGDDHDPGAGATNARRVAPPTQGVTPVAGNNACSEWTVADATFPVRQSTDDAFGKFYQDALREAKANKNQLSFEREGLVADLARLMAANQLTYKTLREACIATGCHVAWSQKNLASYTSIEKRRMYEVGGNLYACLLAIDLLVESQTLDQCQKATLVNIREGFAETFNQTLFAPSNVRDETAGALIDLREIENKVTKVINSPNDPSVFLWYDIPL